MFSIKRVLKYLKNNNNNKIKIQDALTEFCFENENYKT